MAPMTTRRPSSSPPKRHVKRTYPAKPTPLYTPPRDGCDHALAVLLIGITAAAVVAIGLLWSSTAPPPPLAPPLRTRPVFWLATALKGWR